MSAITHAVTERDARPSSTASGDEDSLLECLQIITELYGQRRSLTSLRAGLPRREGPANPDDALRSALVAGMSARLLRRPLATLSPTTLPAILILEDGRGCVITGLDRKTNVATVIFPETGTSEREVALDSLRDQVTENVLFVQPNHRFDARTPPLYQPLSKRWFWRLLAKSWTIYRDVLVASSLINMFALVMPFFIMNVYDRVVPNQAIETLWVLAIGVAVIYLFDLMIRFLRSYLIDTAGKRTDILASSQIFEHVLGIQMPHRPPSVGAFANNLNLFESVRAFITSTTIATLVDLPFVVLFLLAIFFVSGKLVVVPALAIALLIVYALAVQVPIRRAVQETFRASSQKHATLVEALTASETIKSLGAEGTAQRKWEDAVAYMARWGTRSRLLSSSVLTVTHYATQMTVVGIVVFGTYLIGDGELTVGGLIAAVILAGRALSPMSQLASIAANYHQSAVALKSLDAIMALPRERLTTNDYVERPAFSGAVELRDVTFAYPGQTAPALENVSVRINAGERVGIIGKTGSGKTSLQRLLLGLYTPSSGAIYFDGVDVRQIDPAELRRNIGYVPQAVQLFYGSLKENITMGAPTTNDDLLLDAATVSGVTTFSDSHPNGFDLQIEEDGSNLSGGQRQSVAIARALIGKPRMLLMDEPSSALDSTTEQRLMAKLTNALHGATLILITHRASLLSLVERLVVLDHGRVVADGPKDEVLRRLREAPVDEAT